MLEHSKVFLLEDGIKVQMGLIRDLKLADLRELPYLEMTKTIASKMYNHAVILPLNEATLEFLNINSIFFVPVFKNDTDTERQFYMSYKVKTDLFSLTAYNIDDIYDRDVRFQSTCLGFNYANFLRKKHDQSNG